MVAIDQLPEHVEDDARQTEPGLERIERLLARFDPIGLDEMDGVALLDRTDTKFILRLSQLHEALARIAGQYQVLDISQTRLNHYRTLYFDTPDFALYHQHHNGLRARYKVRMREYVDSELAYWEVKRKTNQERTVKARLQTPDPIGRLATQVDDFIDAHAPVDAQDLEFKLWNTFQRITLVSKHQPERLTLDVHLAFGCGDAVVGLPGIAIAEVKQERASRQSDFIAQMRRLGVRSSQFSKYCAGVYMLYDNVKTNNFKARMRLVEKLMQEESDHGPVH